MTPNPWLLIADLLGVAWGSDDAIPDACDAMVNMREALEALPDAACNLPLVLLKPGDACPGCGIPAAFHRNYPKKGNVNYDRQRHGRV